MRLSRKGVSPVLAVAVVVVIVLAGAGAYFLVIVPSQSASPSGSSTTHSSSTGTSTSSSTATSQSSSTSSSSSSASSTTSSASSTSASTSQSTTSTSSSSTCSSTATTSTTTTGSTFNPLNFTGFFASYSEMAVKFNGTINGNTYNITSDYHVLSASKTEYKVNITQGYSGTTLHYTAWVLRNGTAIAVYTNGQNYTGFNAYTYFLAAMSAYIFQNAFASPLVISSLTSPLFTHQTGKATVMLGPTSVVVTTYAPNAVPLSINQCGVMIYFSKFSIQMGSVSGVSQSLLTGISLAGTFSSPGTQTENLNVNILVTSLTKAA